MNPAPTPRLTEEQRDVLIDLLPAGMTLWADDEELPHFADRTWAWWRETLGHPKAHTACCKACGCATTCLLGAFYDAVVSSVVRELDRLGALRTPDTREETAR